VEFWTRKHNQGEAWEELGDTLRLLANKELPDLEDKAKEQLSLDTFLTLLDKPDLALAVKQKRPKNIDEAVSYTYPGNRIVYDDNLPHPAFGFRGWGNSEGTNGY